MGLESRPHSPRAVTLKEYSFVFFLNKDPKLASPLYRRSALNMYHMLRLSVTETNHREKKNGHVLITLPRDAH